MIANDSPETTVPPGLPSSADLDAAEERVREATGKAANPAFEELKRLSAAATQGEWNVPDDMPRCMTFIAEDGVEENLLSETHNGYYCCQHARDARFIVAAVNYVRRQIAGAA